MAAALLAADLLGLSAAAFGGFFVWSRINPSVPPIHPSMLFAIAFCAVAFAFLGLYPGVGRTTVEQIRSLFHGITLSYILLLVSVFLVKEWWHYSRGGVLLSWMASLILVPLGRQLLSSRAWWGVPVMILGAGNTSQMLVRILKVNPGLGFRPVVCLDDDPLKAGTACESVPVVGTLSDARLLAARYKTTYAIAAMPGIERRKLLRHLQTWSSIFPNLLIIPDLLGVASLWVQPRDLGGVLGFEIRHNLLNPINRWLKRAVDLLLSFVGLIIAVPFVALIGIWIKAVSRGPVLYTQKREGRHRRHIHVLKLRTMYPNAEEMLETYLDRNPHARSEWDSFCKLKNDPRILPGVGHFLRRTSLDELPQLWNILKGEMSLVGPRPFPPYHNERFSADFRVLRTQVNPGLTGLWQVSARSNGDLEVQESLDSYYIRNWSLWLDFYVLIRTIRAVISPKGAY